MLIADAKNLALTGPGNPKPVADLPNQFNYIDLTSQLSQNRENGYYNPISETSEFGPWPKNMSGRNIFRGPGAYSFNLSIAKMFRIREGLSLQFRGEMYNVFNHATLYADVGSADIGSVDYIPAYRDGRRNVQFALKLMF